MATKHQVIHPDGSISKRGSKTRTYTHAVQVGPQSPEAMAAECEASAAYFGQIVEMLTKALAEPKVEIRPLGWTTFFGETQQATLVGTSSPKAIFEMAMPNGQTRHGENIEEHLIGRATQAKAIYQAEAEKALALAAAYRSGEKPVEGYGVLRWSMTEAAARKAAASSEFDYARKRGCSIEVVEVEVP